MTFFRVSLVSNSSYPVRIPTALGTRLRVLFCLSRRPETLGELGDLRAECVEKCLKEPRLKAHFQEIREGKKIFGKVDYETRHRIRLPNGRQVYVACALDALIEGFFLPIEIDSICFHCDQPIRIRMSEGTITSVEPSSTVIWLGASKEGSGSCAKNLCPYINFFSSAKHVTTWRDKNPNELGVMITLQQSLELARKGYWKPIGLLKIEKESVEIPSQFRIEFLRREIKINVKDESLERLSLSKIIAAVKKIQSSELLQKIADYYVKNKWLFAAGSIYELKGNLEALQKAEKCYVEGGYYRSAARFCRAIGTPDALKRAYDYSCRIC